MRESRPRPRSVVKGEAEILRRLRRWHANAVVFVQEVFGAEPDAPQADVLMALSRGHPRVAMASSKNTGKTCVEAWAIWWFICTRLHPKIVCTSISEANLKANLWSELSKWQARSPLLQAWFDKSATRIVARKIVSGSPSVDPAETWWCQARTWERHADRQQQSMTLAGVHADSVLFVIDESSGVPDAVMASAEAALAGGGDLHILQGGNTTHLTGPLYRACTKERALWHVVRMTGDPEDPNRSARVDLQWAKDQIAKYDLGRQNPWVMINVLGQFPPHSVNALIGPDLMEEAMRRSYREHDIASFARVLGVDVARQGDDASVMFPRQGLVAFTPTVWRNIDGIQGAAAVSRKWDEWDADGVFVDMTGGFGASWIDCLRLLGRQPIPVLYNGEPHDRRYYNKRAEMAFAAVQWVKDGGQLPPCPELVAQATEITYTFRPGSDRIMLEDKVQYKERTGFSPDHFDAFMQTFAEPLQRRGALELSRAPRRNRHRARVDPYAISEREIMR